jgi:DNA processing protein
MPYPKFSALFYGDFEYPEQLKDARNPVEVLYYRGALDLLSSRSVAVVGARKASELGIQRAKKLAKLLVEHDFTVMSGLAEGIDTAAHTAALEAGGRTIAVIGTALNEVYPRQNLELQQEIARRFLLISQVPFYLYLQRDYRYNRFFFPERNKTMSALSEASVIVEASESSGSLTQAEAAIQQGRKLFILNSCFERGLNWPEKFLKKGAIRVVDSSEILAHLGSATHGNP